MFKPFYIHRQASYMRPKYNGFTAYVEPHEENNRLIKVRVSFCSRKDRFCKRTGREQVLTKEWTVINKRDLPKWAASMFAITNKLELEEAHWFIQAEMFLLKYVV